MGIGFGYLLSLILPNSMISHTLFPPTSKFVPSRDMPDLSGKVVIVTGGSSGIGYETCKQLLLHNARVYLAARSEPKAKAAMQKLSQETGKNVIFLKLDLGDLRSVRKAAEEFKSGETKLDILINNAGVMACPPEELTAQGYDQQFGTNVLGHFFFTELLLPSLAASHAAAGQPARVINTSSIAHLMTPAGTGFDPNWAKGGPARDEAVKKWGGLVAPWNLYGVSKLGNVFVANYLAREHRDILVSCSLHPGAIRSELQRHSGAFARAIGWSLSHPVEKGALTQLYAGTVADPEAINGKYLQPWARFGRPSAQSQNEQTEREVIAYCRKQVEGF